MKKTIVLFIFTLFLLFNTTIKNVDIDASSTNINDLSCANGKNLADPNNLFPDNINGDYYLQTINNIYCPASEHGMVFQFPYEGSYFSIPTVELILYDINGIEVQREFSDSNNFHITNVDDQDFYYTVLPVNQSLNPFSFTFVMTGFTDEYVYSGFPGFMVSRSYTATSYESYVRRNGLFELTNESDATIFVNYSQTLTTNNILSMICAKDAYYGNLENNLEITTNEYVGHESVIGKYRVVVSVSDSSNNSQSGQFFIEVVDIEKPVIEGEDTLRIPVYTEVDDEYILDNYTASDEYDGDISNQMVVVGEYTTNSMTIKEETITIEVEDSSGNKASKSITLSFYDNVPPIITCPETIMLSYQVRKPISNIILDSVNTTDNLDNSPILVVDADSYSGNENKIGNYQVTFKATDVSGNYTTKTIDIIVQDLVKPVIYIDLGTIETLSTVILKVEDISNILYKRKELKRSTKYNVEVLKNTYTGHESIPGSYVLRLRYTSNDEKIEKSFVIKVTEASYVIDTYTPKIDITNIIFISTISILSLSLVALVVSSIIKTKNAKRQSGA